MVNLDFEAELRGVREDLAFASFVLCKKQRYKVAVLHLFFDSMVRAIFCSDAGGLIASLKVKWMVEDLRTFGESSKSPLIMTFVDVIDEAGVDLNNVLNALDACIEKAENLSDLLSVVSLLSGLSPFSYLSDLLGVPQSNIGDVGLLSACVSAPSFIMRALMPTSSSEVLLGGNVLSSQQKIDLANDLIGFFENHKSSLVKSGMFTNSRGGVYCFALIKMSIELLSCIKGILQKNGDLQDVRKVYRYKSVCFKAIIFGR